MEYNDWQRRFIERDRSTGYWRYPAPWGRPYWGNSPYYRPYWRPNWWPNYNYQPVIPMWFRNLVKMAAITAVAVLVVVVELLRLFEMIRVF